MERGEYEKAHTKLARVNGEGINEGRPVDRRQVQVVNHDATHVKRTVHSGGGETVVPPEYTTAGMVWWRDVARTLRRGGARCEVWAVPRI